MYTASGKVITVCVCVYEHMECVYVWAFLPVISRWGVFKDFMSYYISIHIYCCRLKETLCHKNQGKKNFHISPSLQVNPHFIMAAEPARGRLKTTCFWAGSWINYIKGEISLPQRLNVDSPQYHLQILMCVGWMRPNVSATHCYISSYRSHVCGQISWFSSMQLTVQDILYSVRWTLLVITGPPIPSAGLEICFLKKIAKKIHFIITRSRNDCQIFNFLIVFEVIMSDECFHE